MIPICCGTYGETEIAGYGASCPVCLADRSVNLVAHSSRLCCMLVPLFRIGRTTFSARCNSCGSILPTSVAVRQPHFVHVVTNSGLPLSSISSTGGSSGVIVERAPWPPQAQSDDKRSEAAFSTPAGVDEERRALRPDGMK
jgi:hypothetical protein